MRNLVGSKIKTDRSVNDFWSSSQVRTGPTQMKQRCSRERLVRRRNVRVNAVYVVSKLCGQVQNIFRTYDDIW